MPPIPDTFPNPTTTHSFLLSLICALPETCLGPEAIPGIRARRQTDPGLLLRAFLSSAQSPELPLLSPSPPENGKLPPTPIVQVRHINRCRSGWVTQVLLSGHRHSPQGLTEGVSVGLRTFRRQKGAQGAVSGGSRWPSPLLCRSNFAGTHGVIPRILWKPMAWFADPPKPPVSYTGGPFSPACPRALVQSPGHRAVGTQPDPPIPLRPPHPHPPEATCTPRKSHPGPPQ